MGNITEAYKAVCGIKDKGIWENIAGTCMKTKHVDVALHCFANMESASAAAFVTRANNELVSCHLPLSIERRSRVIRREQKFEFSCVLTGGKCEGGSCCHPTG